MKNDRPNALNAIQSVASVGPPPPIPAKAAIAPIIAASTSIHLKVLRVEDSPDAEFE